MLCLKSQSNVTRCHGYPNKNIPDVITNNQSFQVIHSLLLTLSGRCSLPLRLLLSSSLIAYLSTVIPSPSPSMTSFYPRAKISLRCCVKLGLCLLLTAGKSFKHPLREKHAHQSTMSPLTSLPPSSIAIFFSSPP